MAFSRVCVHAINGHAWSHFQTRRLSLIFLTEKESQKHFQIEKDETFDITRTLPLYFGSLYIIEAIKLFYITYYFRELNKSN